MKILELTTKDFLTGIAPHQTAEGKGLFSVAQGVNPFKGLASGSSTSSLVGLLQATVAPTDISSTVVVDTPFASVKDVSGTSTKFIYWIGTSGHFYKLDISGSNNPTDLRSGTPITDPANGIEIFQVKGGTKYLYYWQKTKIGRWDLSGTYSDGLGGDGWTENYIGSGGTISTALQSTNYHPTHKLFDFLFYGNKDRLGKISDVAGVFTHSDNVLDLPTDYEIQALGDDSVYLVIGATTNLSGDENVKGDCRVYFWDTNSNSWNREWAIPVSKIYSILRFDTAMIAVTERGLYQFSFNSPPRKIDRVFYPLITPDTPLTEFADVMGDAILWGGDGYIASFGKLTPDAPTAYFQPFTGFSGTPASMEADARNQIIYLGTTGNKMYRVDNSSGTPTTSTITAETVYIDLGRWYQVKTISLEFLNALSTGASMVVKTQVDPVGSSSTWGTVSYALYGAKRRINLQGSVTTRYLKLIFEFSGGAATERIKNITLIGDRADEGNL